MDRAYRRPVAMAGKAPFVDFYQRLRRDGLSFDAARHSPFQSMLYATGRKLAIDAIGVIEAIMRAHAAEGYPLRLMWLAIFQTKAFVEH